MATFKVKRNFSVGEIIFIPCLADLLPLKNGTATEFTIDSIANDGNTDRTTKLYVTYQSGQERVKIAVTADKAYKVVPSTICEHCGHIICYESDKELLKEYEYYCPDCDENLYGIEIIYT
jgi:ArsR family metal-binding transcriptional regulator